MSTCLLQTIRFDAMNDANPKRDFEIYCNKLDKGNVKYKVEETIEQPDGALIVKIRKQYNAYKMDGYLE